MTGEADITEKPVDPVKVYSEKELIREIEKIASTLLPEKDWSLRIAAMQRVEGLLFGGYDCLTLLSLKQFICMSKEYISGFVALWLFSRY